MNEDDTDTVEAGTNEENEIMADSETENKINMWHHLYLEVKVAAE